MTDNQKTIAKEFTLKGIGLHTGNKVSATFKPGRIDAGINFIRVDLPEKPVIRVCPQTVLTIPGSPRRSTVSNKQGVQVQTIEHLLAALNGLAIDNIDIEIDNNEVPAMDGSGLNFAEAMISSGIKEQDKERRYFLVREPIYIEEGGSVIVALPCPELKISYTLSYDHPLLKSQFLEILANPEIFRNELAGARTFCLESEAEELRSKGVGQGANYENTLVVGASGVIKNKLRFEDEFIRHKMLDLLGDLYVLGEPIKAHIIAIKSGHSQNMKLVKKIDFLKMKSLTAGIGGVSKEYISDEGELDTPTIMKILPHRQPFLFVDRIIHLEKGKRAVGIKNVTINDYFFKGHFPGKPVMPGVIILEALAQVGGVMMLSSEEHRGKLAYFMAADSVKFRKVVVPGDQLIMTVEAGKIKSRTGQVHAKAEVDGKVVCEADFMFALAQN
ncbi:MAG: UDP-3-O-acyl-N-acetylglucosamine deacetylase [Candidatus Omnitrophica bacterium]|nr:UDP-3-O-acyl-N-acetylglucosamine deacetylase [Candidatus Omnitrophota bacterium]